VTLVVVAKADHTLTLFDGDAVVKQYKVALGPNKGPKQREGDGKTPEGRFVIDYRNSRSQFHRALHISYPAPTDVARARRGGYHPGGDIMIHGLGKHFAYLGPLHVARDWTLGCIAVTNSEIEELWRLVRDGTPIEIKP